MGRFIWDLPGQGYWKNWEYRKGQAPRGATPNQDRAPTCLGLLPLLIPLLWPWKTMIQRWENPSKPHSWDSVGAPWSIPMILGFPQGCAPSQGSTFPKIPAGKASALRDICVFSTAATWRQIPGSPTPWDTPSALPSLQHPPRPGELPNPLLLFPVGKIPVPASQAGRKGPSPASGRAKSMEKRSFLRVCSQQWKTGSKTHGKRSFLRVAEPLPQLFWSCLGKNPPLVPTLPHKNVKYSPEWERDVGKEPRATSRDVPGVGKGGDVLGRAGWEVLPVASMALWDRCHSATPPVSPSRCHHPHLSWFPWIYLCAPHPPGSSRGFSGGTRRPGHRAEPPHTRPGPLSPTGPPPGMPGAGLAGRDGKAPGSMPGARVTSHQGDPTAG